MAEKYVHIIGGPAAGKMHLTDRPFINVPDHDHTVEIQPEALKVAEYMDIKYTTYIVDCVRFGVEWWWYAMPEGWDHRRLMNELWRDYSRQMKTLDTAGLHKEGRRLRGEV